MLATETGSVHTELLEKGFSIPVYTYTPFESAGCPSPWWEVTAELQSSIGVLTCKATAPSKKAAKSEVSTLLLARAHAMMPPAQHEIKMRPGFLSPKPIAAFTSGEAKDAKALVRKYGFDFVEAAVKHYLSAGTSDPQDDATPKSASPKSDSSTQTEVVYGACADAVGASTTRTLAREFATTWTALEHRHPARGRFALHAVTLSHARGLHPLLHCRYVGQTHLSFASGHLISCLP